MKLYLKQFDITLNQEYNEISYFEDLDNRINKRMNQINLLHEIINYNEIDKNYYNLVNSVYEIKPDNELFIRTNIITDNNLTIILKVRSDNYIDNNKLYDFKDIVKMFKNNIITLENIDITVFNSSKNNSIKRVSNDKLKELFIYYYNKLSNNMDNKNMINKVKSILSNERLNNDLNELILFTNMEMEYLSNKMDNIIL